MRTHVDWITFTMPMIYMGTDNDAYAMAIQAGFMDMFASDMVASVFGGTWEKNEKSRAPYTDSWRDRDGGISLFASPNLTHCCVEISGQGCERIIGMGKINDVINACRERITRIDIACDIETTVKPVEFVGVLSHERMRTSGQVISDTGETCYIGSQKSERYARVYRYNPPHPRAHLLRVEHVFRKDYAKKVSQALVDNGIEALAVSSGMVFGWAHPIWNPSDMEAPDISVTHERGNSGNTVFWLVNSVAPAFRRLCASGAIVDPAQFLQTYFLTNDI